MSEQCERDDLDQMAAEIMSRLWCRIEPELRRRLAKDLVQDGVAGLRCKQIEELAQHKRAEALGVVYQTRGYGRVSAPEAGRSGRKGRNHA